MQVTKVLIGFLFVLVAASTNAEDMPETCATPTAGQQIVFCKRLALRISTQQVMDLFNQNMSEYQGNDKDVLAKAHLPAAAPQFAKAQKSWTDYKEASCKAEYNYAGSGTLRDIEYLDCLLDFNKRRLEVLQTQ